MIYNENLYKENLKLPKYLMLAKTKLNTAQWLYMQKI